MCSNAKFDKLHERLSERVWMSREGEVEIEDMETPHIRRVIRMIEDGEIDLCGLESDFVEMFTEELEDRGEEVKGDEDEAID